MNESPYIAPQLAATRAGIPDPLVEVDGWLSCLQDLLDVEPATADEAYDLLALCIKLRRTRPELVAQLGASELFSRAGALLADRGSSMAAEALRLPNPSAWLDEAKALEQAYEDAGPAEVRSELADRLLTDLDDADLVLYASRGFGVDDVELEAELARCHDWLAENAVLFLAASVHAQAVGMTIRSDLQAIDYGLAVTAQKYLIVLQAAEVAESELAMEGIEPVAAEVTQRLLARFRQQRDLARSARALFLSAVAVELRKRMRHVALARAGGAAPLEPLWWWEWHSPTGDVVARLTIPPQPAPDQQVVVEFVGPDQRRATGMAGEPITLHGAEAEIDEQGKATLALTSLLDTEEPLLLRVGAKGIPWRLTAGHADVSAVPGIAPSSAAGR